MVDSVKLDRSFFLDDYQRAHDVVESIVELARKLGIETVAEGIEAPEQVDFLRSIGCDLVQGYVYARPMPAEELDAWMRARHGGEVTQILSLSKQSAPAHTCAGALLLSKETTGYAGGAPFCHDTAQVCDIIGYGVYKW